LSASWNPREHYQTQEIAEAYDHTRFNSLPGRLFNRLEKRALLRALSGVPAGAEIIDIPCGTGRLSEALLGSGYRVTAVDISQAMLDQAKRKLARFSDRVCFRLGDATELSPPEKPFAAVVCARILMHFPLPQQIEFLRKVAQQADGIVVFNQSYNSFYHRTRRRLKQRLLLDRRTPVRFPLTEPELQHLLRDSGLVEVRRVWIALGVSEGIFVAAKKSP
jgi:2-polyprenyl-3-methyl-5-hydroxy-6-metoxy-1,4-benzoquinol methylase